MNYCRFLKCLIFVGLASNFFLNPQIQAFTHKKDGIRQTNSQNYWVANTIRGFNELLPIVPNIHKFMNADKMKVLKDSTIEFGNGNTFVKLFSEDIVKSDIKLAYKKIVFFVGGKLTPNQAMELFFKISAARSQMASHIDVYFPQDTELDKIIVSIDPNNSVILLPMRKLLKVSGADGYWLGNRYRDLKHTILTEPVKPFRKGHFAVMSINYPEFAKSLAHELKAPYLSLTDLQASINSENINRVYLVAPPMAPANENILKTLALTHKLKDEHNLFVHILPLYLPYARSDKPEARFGVGSQGRVTADLFETVGMGALTVVRPHAPQSLSLFKVPAFEISGRDTIIAYLNSLDEKPDVVVSPDAGFQKDATLYAQELDLPVAVVNKQRDIAGESKLISGSDLELVRGKTAVIFDDETASGGTLAKVANLLKEHFGAAKVYTAVTHLAGNASAALNSSDIDLFICTNTLPVAQTALDKGIIVLAMEREIAEKISELENQITAFDL